MVLLIAALPAAAQGGEIRGRVVDARTGLPATGALVVLVGHPEYAEVGADGTFRLASRSGTADSLVVTRLGYVALRIAFTGPDDLRLELTPDPVQIARLHVLAHPGQPHRHDIRCPVAGIPVRATSAGSALEFIEDHTGLRPTRCGDSSREGGYCAPLRGSVRRIEAFVDGTRLTDGLAGLGHLPAQHVYFAQMLDRGRVAWVITMGHARAVAAGAAPAVPPP